MHRSIATSALLLAAAIAPAGAAAQRTPIRAPAGRTVRQLHSTAELIAAVGSDIRRLPSVLQSSEVVSSLRRICAVSSPERVTCSSVDEISRFLRLQPSDDKLMRLGLNDFMAGLGLPGTDQTLFMCMGQGTLGPARFGSTGGAGLTAPAGMSLGGTRGPATFTAGQNLSAVTRAPAMGDRSAMSRKCGSSSRTSGLFGAASATDQNYQRAVNAAVAVMDQAMGQCRESGMSPVADAPSGGSTSSGTDKPKEEKPKNSGEQAIENVTTWFSVWAGATERIAVAVAERNIPALVVGVAGLAGDVDKIAADGTATGDTNETLQDAGDAATIAQFAVTAVTEGATTVAAGTAITAIGAAAGTLAVVVPATRWVDNKTGLGDAVVNWAVSRNENSVEYKKQYGIQHAPAPGETDRATCAQMQAAWQRFRDYCSQPGNNWQTYDCAKFVARMNGCADPATVNPGPNGDYVCRARPTTRDRAIRACEAQRRKIDMIGYRTSDAQRPSCASAVDRLTSARANAQAIFRERQCTKANPGDDGPICPGAAPAGGGGSVPPRPSPASGRGS